MESTATLKNSSVCPKEFGAVLAARWFSIEMDSYWSTCSRRVLNAVDLSFKHVMVDKAFSSIINPFNPCCFDLTDSSPSPRVFEEMEGMFRLVLRLMRFSGELIDPTSKKKCEFSFIEADNVPLRSFCPLCLKLCANSSNSFNLMEILTSNMVFCESSRLDSKP